MAGETATALAAVASGALVAVLAWLRGRSKDRVDAAQVALAAERAERAAERVIAVADRLAARIEHRESQVEIESLKEAAAVHRDQIADLRRTVRGLEAAMRAAGVALPDDTPAHGAPAQGGTP